jgi:hypothetical protein
MARKRNVRREEMSKANLELRVLIQHFQVHNRTERKSDRTVEWYDQVLGMFHNWLKAEGMSTVLGDIGEIEVGRFILYYQERVGVNDVHLEDHYIKVNGKGNKERIVAFGHACRRALLHYYHHFRAQPVNDQTNTFFLTLDGYSMASGGIQSMVKRLADTSKVARLHPHLMRYTYATSFLMNGGDIFFLQQNLAHSSLKMVQHYLQIASWGCES